MDNQNSKLIKAKTELIRLRRSRKPIGNRPLSKDIKQVPKFSLSKRVRALSKIVGRRLAFDITKVAEKLGEGAFGAVYDYKGFAVKVAAGSPATKTGYRELEVEKKILKDAEVSGVSPKVIDSGKGYVAIEKFEGYPLFKLLDRIKKESKFSDFIFRKIIEAVGALHRTFIAHNDIHEGNVFVLKDYTVKIIDFGLAKKGIHAAFVESLFGVYGIPGAGAISNIKDFFKNSPSLKIYYKVLNEHILEICEYAGADPEYVFKDYENITSEEEEEIYFNNYNKLYIDMGREDEKKFLLSLYDKLDSALRINSKRYQSPAKRKSIPRLVAPRTPMVKRFAKGGDVFRTTLSLVGEKKGTLRAKTPLLTRKQKIETILKRSKSFTMSAEELTAAMGKLNASDFKSLKPLIKKSQKSNIIRVNDFHLWSFLNRFNLFLDNFIRTLSTLAQYTRLKYEFTNFDLEEFPKKEKALTKTAEKAKKVKNKTTKKKKRKKDKETKKKAKTKLTVGRRGGEPGPAALTATSALTGTFSQQQIPSGPDNFSGSGNAQKIFNFFKSKGFTDYQAAAFVGNFSQESGLNPKIKNGIGAYGIAQWYDRFPALQQFASRNNIPIDSLETQLKFSWYELQGSERRAYNLIKNTKNVDEAAVVIRKEYERPGESEANDANRIRISRNTLIKYGENSSQTNNLQQNNQNNNQNSNRPAKNKATGGIVIPELFKDYKIFTNEKNNLTQFIADKPTLIEMSAYKEPLIIIPIGRTRGKEILKILFNKTFQKLETTIKAKLENQTTKTENIVINKTDNLRTRIDSKRQNIFYTENVSTNKKVVIYTQDIYVT